MGRSKSHTTCDLSAIREAGAEGKRACRERQGERSPCTKPANSVILLQIFSENSANKEDNAPRLPNVAATLRMFFPTWEPRLDAAQLSARDNLSWEEGSPDRHRHIPHSLHPFPSHCCFFSCFVNTRALIPHQSPLCVRALPATAVSFATMLLY